MAMRILAKSKLLRTENINVIQKLENLLIIDFEATCEKNFAIPTPEIIEFPCVAVNTKNWQIDNVFHKYVKPRINPILSPFCTDLTGIMQETIDNEEHFPMVFEKFQKWLEINGYSNNNSSGFVTSGDWDLKVMLPNQCKLDDLTVPDNFKQWIDLKKIFFNANQYYPRSIKDMLRKLNLSHEGRLHSGLSDSLNMLKIIQTLVTNKPTIQFDITSHLHK
ncbi:hypothetical protein PV325_005127 [Microctonus aethiopoides]|uniref:Exonuclease domain-containing protein n=1 Tax=Microctonus aethiopoides TaxID=144406 RepID=A0AA39KRM3_9HYME|nr:hypothetical protein PV325_005127 [Microctonus aethiopoides]KAK0171353.1 hypothetical protein PV328_009094 [Microctonus aethiopoides]